MTLSKRWTRVLAAAAIIAAVLAGAPAAQAVPTYTVTGAVTDRVTGAPLPGACVDLFNSPDKLMASRCTDEHGRYAFTGLTRTNPAKLRAREAGHAELWWPSEPDYYNANTLVYPTDGSTTIGADLALTVAVGGFAGRITQPDGSPAYASEVTAVAVGDAYWSAEAPTDSDGRYRLGNLPVGSYRLAIGPRGWSPTQWIPGTGSPQVATVFDVTADATTTVDGKYLATTTAYEGGALTGVVTAAAIGTPVAGACVTAVSSYTGQDTATSCTDATGRYRFAKLSTNLGYKLRISADHHPEQWAPNAVDSRNASIYFPQWGRDTVVDVALRVGGGTVRGQVTDYPGATPALVTSVRVVAVDNSWSSWTTVVDGRYEIDRVPPGDYRVAVKPLDRTVQYHPGKATATQGMIVHVTDGEVTTVDEQLVPPGAVELTLVDEATGSPVKGCARLISAQEVACGDTGTVTFPKVWATGDTPDRVLVDPKPTHWSKIVSPVAVASGETTRLTVSLEPGAALETSIVDATDGSVPPKTCVRAVSAAKLVVSPIREDPTSGASGYCSDSSGKIRIGPLPSGPVQLLVLPLAPYGAQWYTEQGGTGDRRVATVYSLRVGQKMTAPPIRLDRGGALTGRITDRSGKPLVSACLQAHGRNADLASVGLRTCADSSGSYTLGRLGPYRWPLNVDGQVITDETILAPAWSGNATNRFDATLLQVTAGATTKVPDIVLPPAAKIQRMDVGTTDKQIGTVEVYQWKTGDRVGYGAVLGAGTNLTTLPAGPVLLRVVPTSGTPCWYVGPPIGPRVPRKPGPTTINLAPGQVVDTIRLVPGDTCKAVPTDIRIGPALLTPTR